MRIAIPISTHFFWVRLYVVLMFYSSMSCHFRDSPMLFRAFIVAIITIGGNALRSITSFREFVFSLLYVAGCANKFRNHCLAVGV